MMNDRPAFDQTFYITEMPVLPFPIVNTCHAVPFYYNMNVNYMTVTVTLLKGDRFGVPIYLFNEI